jgi:CDP-glucose 4,6-dehydratase
MVMPEYFSAFRGQRVFVTGHTGFKGSWLAFLLREIGAEVMGYALPPLGPDSHFTALRLAERVRHVEGDIRDAEKLRATIEDFQPQFVFHLAAQALVKASYLDPQATFATNVIGSANLLDAIRQCDAVRSLVYVTSDKCYENVGWIWGYRENDRLGGHDPYSASKAAAEIVFEAYMRSFFAHRPGLGAATARAGNVIGGGDWAADRIVPDCVRAIRSGEAIQLRNPRATRPWQHVLEPLSGYLLLAARLYEAPRRFAGAWNFGPSDEVLTVSDVAEGIVERFGRGAIQYAPGDPLHHEAQLLRLNCDKAQQLLGWHPRWNAKQTLALTADWYRAVLSGTDANSVTREQIQQYFEYSP